MKPLPAALAIIGSCLVTTVVPVAGVAIALACGLLALLYGMHDLRMLPTLAAPVAAIRERTGSSTYPLLLMCAGAAIGAREMVGADRPPPAAIRPAPAPLEVVRSAITPDILGQPHLRITVRNVTAKTIDAVEFNAAMLNNFNEPVMSSLNPQEVGSNFRGSANVQVPPTASGATVELGPWQTFFYEGASKALATVTRVHFTDGTTWEGEATQIEDPRRPAR